MQEMETLWKEGIDMFDGFTRQTFNLRAIIFTTIHDYQDLFVLSGQIKGRTGCTVCVDEKSFNSKKIAEQIQKL